ncbi:MAG TPA: amidase [Bacteroidales bacterium]|jgi:amidase|nr:amidase [Bacteroidales bacterium]HQH24541.1 amidase [Bacteroidales bacterium]HQJ83425.1 amidase [Bacteroidales bacterium]
MKGGSTIKKTAYIAFFLFMIACQPPVNNTGTREYKVHPWLEELTIAGLRKAYQDGRYTISEVVKAYIERINKIDMAGPELNSIISINPDALSISAELDREMREGRLRGPLHGIPVILKDNIDTGDRMPTTAGSNALAASFASRDSYIAGKLREAGAVIIGKANLSEFANFRARTSSSGWSAVGGQTKNPYVLDRNPCGSSSGSGVAVSANLCMAAIGTETNGSIVCPSNHNGIVGIKPTVGLLSRRGIIPISYTQDTPGPMARTVEDAAAFLGAMTGIDPEDLKTLESEGKSHRDYTKFLDADGLKGKRIGLVKNSGGFSVHVDTLMMRAIRDIKAAGAEVTEVDAPPSGTYGGASFQVMLYEFRDGLNRYFSGLAEGMPVRSLKDLIEFNLKDSVELKYFDQNILIEAEKKGDLNTPEYKQALSAMLRATRENGIDRMMDDNRLDALIAPTGSPAWKTDLILGDYSRGGSSSLAAISGYPAITVPMGFVNELPVGITFFGRAWSEALLIEIAYAYEQATRHRKPPRFRATD